MNKFEEGQLAAAEALREIAEHYGDFTDALNFVNETVHESLEKTASEQDFDVKRGIDSVMFDFMKHASQIAGSYDLSDMDSRDVFGAVLYSMANEYDSDESYDEGEYGEPLWKEAAKSSMNTGDLLPVSNYMKPKNAENVTTVDGKSQPSRFHTASSKISDAFGKSVHTGSSMTTKRMA